MINKFRYRKPQAPTQNKEVLEKKNGSDKERDDKSRVLDNETKRRLKVSWQYLN